MSRPVLFVAIALLLGACASEAESKIEITGLEPEASGPEGWAVVATAAFTEAHFTRERSQDEWELQGQESVDPSRVRWEAQSAQHGTVALQVVQWPEAAPWGPHAPNTMLAPGEWTLSGYVDDALIVSASHEVSPIGQDPDHNPNLVQDVLFELPRGLGWVGAQRWPFDILERSLLVELTDLEDGSFESVRIFSAGEKGICRMWSGVIAHDPNGLMTADVGDIIAGGDVRLDDVHLQFGVDLNGMVLEGLALDLAFDGRDLDRLAAPSGTEPVEGAFCDAIGKLDFVCRACEDGTGEFCSELHSYSGTGSIAVEEQVLARYADYGDLDDVPPCGEPEDGSFAFGDLACSTLGSTGVAAWMVAIGMIGLRRRKSHRSMVK